MVRVRGDLIIALYLIPATAFLILERRLIAQSRLCVRLLIAAVVLFAVDSVLDSTGSRLDELLEIAVAGVLVVAFAALAITHLAAELRSVGVAPQLMPAGSSNGAAMPRFDAVRVPGDGVRPSRRVAADTTIPGRAADAEALVRPAPLAGVDRRLRSRGQARGRLAAGRRAPRVGVAAQGPRARAGAGHGVRAAQRPDGRVEDERLRGTQTVTFEVRPATSVHVTLTLDYELKERTFLTPLVDLLFIRRELSDSLSRTLTRFGARAACRALTAARCSPCSCSRQESSARG